MTSADELCWIDAGALSLALTKRTLSPVDIVDAHLARIDTFEPTLKAFTDVQHKSARLAAEAADKAIKSGHAIGPLHGVPVAIKDLVDIEGQITMGGSAALRTRRSTVTATIVRKMIAQGMIVLGKTHTVEFAMGGWGTNQHLGTPWNPWDLKTARTPGGSSSGSGVAVAAGLAPWAIGTDTGGSVRLPASFCGLTGLKVTVGRISTYGIIPLSTTLDTPGPMARSVEDAALLYNVLQGPDRADATTWGIEATDPLLVLARGVKGLRIARMPSVEREGVDADVLSAYDRSFAVLADAGAEIVDITLPFRFADLLAAQAIVQAEAFFFNGHLASDPAQPLDDAVRKRLLAGSTVTATEYLRTKRQQKELQQLLYAAMSGVDALLTPTTETAAIPLVEVDQDKVPSRFTRFGNMLELCALALPNGFTHIGLPTSLQIVCRGYDEATALRIGYAFQKVTDWHRKRPAL